MEKRGFIVFLLFLLVIPLSFANTLVLDQDTNPPNFPYVVLGEANKTVSSNITYNNYTYNFINESTNYTLVNETIDLKISNYNTTLWTTVLQDIIDDITALFGLSHSHNQYLNTTSNVTFNMVNNLSWDTNGNEIFMNISSSDASQTDLCFEYNGTEHCFADICLSNGTTYNGTACSTDLSGYVPYTGANQNVNLGANNFSVDTNVLFVNNNLNRVGIGTLTPAYELDVSGNIRGNSSIISPFYTTTSSGSNKTIISLTSAGSKYGTLQVEPATGTGAWSLGYQSASGNTIGTPVLSWTGSGNVGIGTTSPVTLLHVNGTATNPATFRHSGDNYVYFDVSNTQNNLYLGVEKSTGGSISVGSLAKAGVITTSQDNTAIHIGPAQDVDMTILDNGSVGIGTTAPAIKLSIEGSPQALPATSGTTQTGAGLLVSPSDSSRGIYVGLSTTYGGWLQVTNSDNFANTYPLLLNPNGGNVGIGTTTPSSKLDVNGSAKIQNNLNITSGIICNATDCFTLTDLNKTGGNNASFNQSLTDTLYVPYTGASQNVDLNYKNLSNINYLSVNGSVGIGTDYLVLGHVTVQKNGTSSNALSLQDTRPYDNPPSAGVNFAGRKNNTAYTRYAIIGGGKENTILNDAKGYFLIYTDTGTGVTEKFRITSDGTVKIQNNLNMTDGNITDLDTIFVHNISGRSPIGMTDNVQAYKNITVFDSLITNNICNSTGNCFSLTELNKTGSGSAYDDSWINDTIDYKINQSNNSMVDYVLWVNSTNGAGGGGSQTLAQTLALGNATDGNNITFNIDGDLIVGNGSISIDPYNRIMYASDGSDQILNFNTTGNANFIDSDISTTGIAYLPNIYGYKLGGASPNWYLGDGTGTNGGTFDVDNGLIRFDSGGYLEDGTRISIDPYNRKLHFSDGSEALDFSTSNNIYVRSGLIMNTGYSFEMSGGSHIGDGSVESIDPSNRYLYDSTGSTVTVNWNSKYLQGGVWNLAYDNFATIGSSYGIDFPNGATIRDGGLISIDPYNRLLYATDGTTQMLDWTGSQNNGDVRLRIPSDTGKFLDNSNNPIFDWSSGQIRMGYDRDLLLDPYGGTSHANKFQTQGGDVQIDNSGYLIMGSGSLITDGTYTSIDPYNRVLYDSGNSAVFNWNTQDYIITSLVGFQDSSAKTFIETENRRLIASDGSDIVLDWSSAGTANFGDSAITTTGSGDMGASVEADAYTVGGSSGVTDTYDDGVDTVITFTSGLATGISTAYDEILMTNITYSGSNYATELTPINFYWNAQGLKQFPNTLNKTGLQTGYKASDVEQFYPECIVNEKLKQFGYVNKTKLESYITTEQRQINKTYEIKTEIKKEDAFAEKIEQPTKIINTTCYDYNLKLYNCTKTINDTIKASVVTSVLKNGVMFDKFTGKYYINVEAINTTYTNINVTKMRNVSYQVYEPKTTLINVKTYNRNCLQTKQTDELNDIKSENQRIKNCAKDSVDYKTYQKCVTK